jgi:hypothetical protein
MQLIEMPQAASEARGIFITERYWAYTQRHKLTVCSMAFSLLMLSSFPCKSHKWQAILLGRHRRYKFSPYCLLHSIVNIPG